MIDILILFAHMLCGIIAVPVLLALLWALLLLLDTLCELVTMWRHE